MKWDIKRIVALFCVPVNVLLILFGIIINDMQVVAVALCSIGLLILPLAYEYYEQKEESNEQDS